MSRKWLGLVLVGPLVLAGCGDATKDSTGDASGSPTSTSSSCASGSAPAGQPVAELDLDGDGTSEPVSYVPAAGSCPASLAVTVGGHDLSARVDGELPVTSAGAAAVAFPGRTGAVLLVRPAHPRGGFQARLFGYADGRFEELRAEGEPIFGFIATDVLTTPTAAHCVADGFDVVQARAHEPIGVVPAWDVFRTTYTVDGNQVSEGPTTEVADNVLDRQLQRRYGDLVDYALFQDCLAGA
jgi:hypothetical protein